MRKSLMMASVALAMATAASPGVSRSERTVLGERSGRARGNKYGHLTWKESRPENKDMPRRVALRAQQ